MKKIKCMASLLLLLLVMLMPGRCALALGMQAPAAADRVLDKADIWSESEEAEFRDSIEALSETYHTDVVLLTVYMLYDAALGDQTYSSAADFADDFYDRGGYGYGNGRTGLILVISMEPGNRQYHFSTSGREYESYSSSDISFVQGEIQPLLTGADYDGAARRFLELVKLHEESGHFDIGLAKTDDSDMLWSLGLALLVAWAVTSNMKRRMNPVQKASRARNYAVPGSYELRHYNEVFLGTSVSRRPRSQNRQGGGHIGHSGAGHGGGGGRF